MNVTFIRSEPVAKNTFTFWFKPERRMRYIAGQFTEIHLQHETVDERGIRRWFTLSSSPSEDMVSITTKLDASKGSTFKTHLAKLQPGEELQLADPMGDFVLPKDPNIPIVLVAAGLGITPVHSMIKWLTDTGEKRDIHLIYAVTHEKDLAFLPLFDAYGLRLTILIKNKDGRLTTERILDLAKPTTSTLIYLSGPEPMTEAFYKELKTKGIKEEQLVTDYYPGYDAF